MSIKYLTTILSIAAMHAIQRSQQSSLTRFTSPVYISGGVPPSKNGGRPMFKQNRRAQMKKNCRK